MHELLSEPGYRRMIHGHVGGNGPARLTGRKPHKCRSPLMLGQLMAAAHPDATRPGSTAAVRSAFVDTFALVLRQSRQEGEEALPHPGREIEVWLVQHPDGRPAHVDALHDRDTVHHRPRCPVPFGQYQHVAGAKRIDSLFQFRAVPHLLSRRLLSIDIIASDGAQGSDLTIKVLMGGRYAGIADVGHWDLFPFIRP